MKQVGHVSGNSYGYWGHEFSILLINMFPFIKEYVLHKTGKTIANEYMSTPPKKY